MSKSKSLILNELIKYYSDGNDAEFARKLGITPQALSNWKARNKIDYETVYTKCLELDANWLMTGEGSMFRKPKTSSLSTTGTPLISLDAAAGFGNLNFAISEENVQARYVVPDFADIDFMIRLKGNSMYPKYSSGDVVACRIIRESKVIQWNKAYVIATLEQGIICKRIRRSTVADCLLAVSDNKEYEPFDLPVNEITGMALVVGVIRLE